MKKIKIITLLLALILIYAYIITIQSLPENIIIFEGETINVKKYMGFKIKSNSIETSSSNSKSINNVGKTKVKVSLFDNIFIKDMEVDVLPRTKVIPVGNVAGVRLYTSGVLVVGMSEIEGIDNKRHKPYEKTGIEEGDTIISIDNNKISSTEELIENVNKSKGQDIQIEYIHNNSTLTCSITPVKTASSDYKLGLWVRDSAARSWHSNIL